MDQGHLFQEIVVLVQELLVVGMMLQESMLEEVMEDTIPQVSM